MNIVKKILYIRSGPYKPNIRNYNMQEIGFAKALLKYGVSTDIVYFSDKTKVDTYKKGDNAEIRILWEKGYKILRTGYYPQLLLDKFLNTYDLIVVTEFSQIMTYLVSKRNENCVLYSGPYYNLFKLPFVEIIYDKFFTKKINSQIKKIFVKSTLANQYLSKKGYTNIHTLGVGLDADKFKNAKPLNDNTKPLVEFMKKNRCILFVGTLCDRKNFSFILEVFSEMKRKYDSKLKMVIVGQGKKSYVKEAFEKIDSETKLSVIHVNNIENEQLRYVYEQSEMFILPSKFEIFGMVLLEAMYFSNCVFTSVNGGAATLINNDNGYIFENFNIDQWAEKIVELENNDRLLQSVQREANKTILEGFLWDKIAESFIDELRGEYEFDMSNREV